MKAELRIPEKLIPVFDGPADVRGAYGGRGSAKTRTFAIMAAVRAYALAAGGNRGVILCARQFMNTLADSSLDEVKAAIRGEEWLEPHFEIGENYIKTRDGRIEFAFSGLARNINSIKSKARILLCWVDEAEHVTDSAWQILIPTIREDGSELWVTWNPERKGSPVDTRFRGSDDPLYKIAEMNWRDNPKFPEKLERERQRTLKERPEEYDHIWEGDYKRAHVGSYFAKQIADAKYSDRIGRVAADDLLIHRLFADIGGTGAKSDNFVFWVAQFVGKEIRVLNHYEVQGQPIGSHLEWMRGQKLTPERAKIWLPHDGETNDRVFDISYESAFKKAGYEVVVIPNQGRGAASQRIESVRRVFPNIWINKDTTEAGMMALGYYHEKKDEERGIGLGPDHDWSSHSADAFGLMSIVYEKHDKSTVVQRDPYRHWN